MFVANCFDVLKTIQESCKTFESLLNDFCKLVRSKYYIILNSSIDVYSYLIG